MPVMGPSKDFAYEQGDKAYDAVMKLLAEQFHVSPVSWVFGVPGLVETRQKVLDDLRNALREVIWQDHCEGF